MFAFCTDITVERTRPDKSVYRFRFSGVNEVRVKRSLHDFTDTCIIRIPSIGRIYRKNGGADATLSAMANAFSEGDKLTVLLGYNGDVRMEFEGFLKLKGLGMPLELICEGYVRQMRLNIHINGPLESTTAKELLLMATGQMDIDKKKIASPLTDIKVVCNVDMSITDLQLINADGVAICNKIKELSLGTLAVFFIEPKVLWCGLTYTPYAAGNDPFDTGNVNYRLGYNCLKDNNLKVRVPVEEVQVLVNHVTATGQKVETKSQAEHAKRKEKHYLKNVPSKTTATSFANEKQYQANYSGYEGSLTGFLQPYCLPGYKANIADSRYPERNGVYMIDGVDVVFGMSGARRNVEIGPQIGFKTK